MPIPAANAPLPPDAPENVIVLPGIIAAVPREDFIFSAHAEQ